MTQQPVGSVKLVTAQGEDTLTIEHHNLYVQEFHASLKPLMVLNSPAMALPAIAQWPLQWRHWNPPKPAPR